ncbi:glycosyltransferase family 4 protein [Mechercharimyces sp. CAU 1602]|uniref:glycosyltransferase family 4 protein n=1 Tax=Mechercharimyces sp. CAU 1602 TaxID=2973933 RepID=UPI002162BD4B|nr:glycosyltransferase family 4 protein [Mechercharimyces sp. CAU 1602]MCS1351114.1 glycosyltransferase family 4 protein [Mechercharimyces sp. CAU 1602]
MKEKKWLFFSHFCQQERMTGAERLILLMGEKVKRLFPQDQSILVVPQEGKLARMARAQGIEVRRLAYSLSWTMIKGKKSLGDDLFLGRSPVIDPQEMKRMVQFLRTEKPTAIVVNTAVNVLPAQAAKRLGIPVIWWIQEVIAEERRAFAVRTIHRFADVILASSQAAIQALHYNNQNKSKLELLYPTWDQSITAPRRWSSIRKQERAQWGVGEEECVVGYIAPQMSEKKGTLDFVNLGLSLDEKKVKAQLAVRADTTDEVYAEQCISLIKHSPACNNFRIIPFMHQVERFYTAIDLLVVPSQVEEGFGLTALEGMLFAKPVVAYEAGGLAEVMRRTKNQYYLVDKGDIETLTEKVALLVNDAQRRQRVGTQNRELAQNSFSPASFQHAVRTLLTRFR